MIWLFALHQISAVVTAALHRKRFCFTVVAQWQLPKTPDSWEMNACPCSKFSFFFFALHCGLLFSLPFLRVVGFFNEHFDPTQVWRWCLCDPGGKKRKIQKIKICSSRLCILTSGEQWRPATQGPPRTLRLSGLVSCREPVAPHRLSFCKCFMLLVVAVNHVLPMRASPHHSLKFHNDIAAAPCREETAILFSRIGFDTEQLCRARHHSNTPELAASVFRHGYK